MAFITAIRGRLVLDFSWRKVRCREYLGLPDTREGRAKARQIKRRVEGELAATTFEYLKWFPEGAKAGLFAPPVPDREAVPPVAAYAREWLENRRAWFSPATYYDRRRIVEGKLVPFFGDSMLVSEVTQEGVERFVNAVKEHPGIRRSGPRWTG